MSSKSRTIMLHGDAVQVRGVVISRLADGSIGIGVDGFIVDDAGMAHDLRLRDITKVSGKKIEDILEHARRLLAHDTGLDDEDPGESV